jgi:hypothetical protein
MYWLDEAEPPEEPRDEPRDERWDERRGERWDERWSEQRWPKRRWSDHSWWDGRTSPTLDRLTHLVLVDGRLVDMWSEPVAGTRWQHHADRLERDRRPSAPSWPAEPAHEQVLAWLDAAVGGREQLIALEEFSASDDDFEPHPDLPPPARELLADVVDLLDTGARTLREPEARLLLHRALASVWTSDPDAVLGAGSAARVAAGLCWLVGKANGWFGPGGRVTQGRVKDALACPTTLSVAGRAYQQAVAGFWPQPPRASYLLPDLLLLGRPELLTAATRRRLVRSRDQALAAAAALQTVKQTVPPAASGP